MLDPVRAGKVSQRFELREGDCGRDASGSDCDRGNERSEVRSIAEWSPNATEWVGGSVYIPKGFETSVDSTHILQIRANIDKKLKFSPAAFDLTLMQGKFVATLGWLDADDQQHFDRINLGSASKLQGRWTDFVVGFGPQTDNRIVVFQNGRQILNEPLRYIGAKSYFLKYGIVRSTAKYVNVLYWDEMRMGKSQAAVAVDENNPVD